MLSAALLPLPHSRASGTAECLAAVLESLTGACLGLPPSAAFLNLGLGKSALSNNGGEQEHGLYILLHPMTITRRINIVLTLCNVMWT